MTQWEYSLYLTEGKYGGEASALARLGLDGWELGAMVYFPGDDYLAHYFKRPLDITPPAKPELDITQAARTIESLQATVEEERERTRKAVVSMQAYAVEVNQLREDHVVLKNQTYACREQWNRLKVHMKLTAPIFAPPYPDGQPAISPSVALLVLWEMEAIEKAIEEGDEEGDEDESV